MVRRRNNIVMVILPAPERVRLPNGEKVLAKYEKRNRLPFLEM